MRIVVRQHPNATKLDLSAVTVIKENLNHIFFVKYHVLEIFNGAREEAIVGTAPIHTNSGANRKLRLIFRLYLVNLWIKRKEGPLKTVLKRERKGSKN